MQPKNISKQENKQSAAPIVAVVGALELGQQVLPQYLRRHHPQIAVIEVGAFARQLAEEADKKASKEYDTSAKEMAQLGAEFVISQLVEVINQSDEWQATPLIIIGIRTPAEAAMLKENFGKNLMLAHIEVRQEQATAQQTSASDPLQSVEAPYKIAELADVILWNDGSLNHFYRQIDAKIVPHILNAPLSGS